MKVLVVHNRYQDRYPSGENAVVQAEIDLLEAGGVEVVPCIDSSDRLLEGSSATRLEAALGPVYGFKGVPAFRSLIRSQRPDVVHVHNVFPFFSPWIVRAAKSTATPVVQTVHNYRHSCVNGLHVREGRRCDDCLHRRVPWPAVQHGCYRGSRLQSLPMATSQVVHQGTWRDVDAFLALTPFMRDRLIQSGLPADRIRLRPTWVRDPGVASPPARQLDVAFIGRLDEPKGVMLLLRAWMYGSWPGRGRLFIAGDGPLAAAVSDAARADASISFVGRLEEAAVADLLGRVAFVVAPSIFYEGFPLGIAEAFAKGRPVLLPSGGSVASVVGADLGWTCELSESGLRQALAGVSLEDCQRKGEAARAFFTAHLTPDRAFDGLLDIYNAVQPR